VWHVWPDGVMTTASLRSIIAWLRERRESTSIYHVFRSCMYLSSRLAMRYVIMLPCYRSTKCGTSVIWLPASLSFTTTTRVAPRLARTSTWTLSKSLQLDLSIRHRMLSHIIVLLGLGALALATYRATRNHQRLPPGPPSLPIIGHLHLIPQKRQWITYGQWKAVYG
jgi:hypothetical protein